MGKLFDDGEAAKRLNLSRQTLRNWRFNNTGPAYRRFGRSVRYTEEDIQEYIDQSRVVPVGNQA